jgi:hypothetical protein
MVIDSPATKSLKVAALLSVVAPATPSVLTRVAPAVPPTIFPATRFVRVIPEPVPPILPLFGIVIVFVAAYPVPLSVIFIDPNVPSAAMVTVANAPVPDPPVPRATFL